MVARIGSGKHGWSTAEQEVQSGMVGCRGNAKPKSEETRRLKHKTIPRHVNRDKHDARQIAHLQSRSQSGEKVDRAHRPQAGRHKGEDRRGKDHLFLTNATDSQNVKAVLNRLESESSIFSHVGKQS